MKKYPLILATSLTLLASPLTVSAQDDSILFDEYIISQEFVEAEVRRIKRAERKLVVRGTKRGQVREFFVPEGTEITIKGKTSNFRDIRKGDYVMVSMQPQANEVIIGRLMVPKTDMSVMDRQTNPVDDALPATLPQTASSWYSVLLAGFVALLGAGVLRTRRKMK